MIVTVRAIDVNTEEAKTISLDVDLSEFNECMDGESVREFLDIVICDDANVVDIDEEDLYVEAERIYQKLRLADKYE